MGRALPRRHTSLSHWYYLAKYRRSTLNGKNEIVEIRRKDLTHCFPPFKVTKVSGTDTIDQLPMTSY